MPAHATQAAPALRSHGSLNRSTSNAAHVLHAPHTPSMSSYAPSIGPARGARGLGPNAQAEAFRSAPPEALRQGQAVCGIMQYVP